MTETITLDAKLRGFVRRDTKTRWIAACPSIGVVSQGTNADDAKRCLREAVELWFENCVERGVLDQAMRELNFRPATSRVAGDDDAPADDVLGDAFTIDVEIPAYTAEAVTA